MSPFSSTFNTVIVGAGVIGCAVARELGARGLRSVVIDDRPPAGGATQASAGILAPYIEAHDRGPLLELGVRSLGLYDSWIDAVRRESGTDVEYRRAGTLQIALDSDRAAALRSGAADAHPGATITWLDAADAHTLEPALGPLAGALHTPSHGYVAAGQLTRALAQAAQRQGATFRRARAHRIARDGSGLRVHTSHGDLTAATVVLAAGSWMSQISIDGERPPPVRPVRGQLLHLSWHGAPIRHILWGPNCYIVPWADGSLLVGATLEDVGFDERATAAGVRDLLNAACELLPDGWGAGFLGVRVGVRPATPDDLPVLGPGAMPGLVHASGHYRNGILLAPLTARLVADWIADGRRDPALETLRPDRFTPRSPGLQT